MNINLYGISAPKAGAAPASQESAARRYAELRSAAAAGNAAGNEHTDTVSISSEGSRGRDAARVTRGVMEEIRRADRDEPARVADIRQRVASGTYFVSTGAVADAILRQALGI